MDEYQKSEKEKILLAISGLNPISLRKRFIHELTNVLTNYTSSQITVTITSDSSVIVELAIDSTRYIFDIGEHYPFQPPRKINVNFIEYSSLLRLPVRFRILYEKLTREKCMCCSSVICNANWSPAITMNKLIVEINRSRKLIRQIVLILLIEQIKVKHLLADLEISSFLF